MSLSLKGHQMFLCILLCLCHFHGKKMYCISVTHLVKNLPAMQETCVRFLGWDDPLEKETASYSSILVCKIP